MLANCECDILGFHIGEAIRSDLGWSMSLRIGERAKEPQNLPNHRVVYPGLDLMIWWRICGSSFLVVGNVALQNVRFQLGDFEDDVFTIKKVLKLMVSTCFFWWCFLGGKIHRKTSDDVGLSPVLGKGDNPTYMILLFAKHDTMSWVPPSCNLKRPLLGSSRTLVCSQHFQHKYLLAKTLAVRYTLSPNLAPLIFYGNSPKVKPLAGDLSFA